MSDQKKVAIKAYQQAQVNTFDQLNLVSMLYEGAIRFLRQSIVHIDNKNFEMAHKLLIRSQDIVTELLISLDVKSESEVVKSLLALYEYMYRRLVYANLEKNTTEIANVIKLLENLLEGWRAVAKSKKQASVNSTATTNVYG